MTYFVFVLGGPGGSSLTGLFAEHGPFDHELIPREHSWYLNHNIVYIDSPAGTGYSFCDSDDGYARTEDDVGKDLLNALQQFFLLFPNLQNNEFFISGESYGSKFVLAAGYAIYQDSKRQTKNNNLNGDGPLIPKINLKGLTIGNGYIDPMCQFIYSDYLYQLGMIDANGRQAFRNYEKRQIDCLKKLDYECAYDTFTQMIHTKEGSLFRNLTGHNTYFNYLRTEPTSLHTFVPFVQTNEIRRAIHVGRNNFTKLQTMKQEKFYLKLDLMYSVVDWLAELLSYYSILIYNGQLDIIAAYPMTQDCINNLNFAGADQYKAASRIFWRVDNELAGYAKHGGNLTTVLVRQAGKIHVLICKMY